MHIKVQAVQRQNQASFLSYRMNLYTVTLKENLYRYATHIYWIRRKFT